MKKSLLTTIMLSALCLGSYAQDITLPEANAHAKTMSVGEALASRHSVREYSKQPLSLQEISNVCWAACGRSRDDNYRTAPTAMNRKEIRLFAFTAEGTYEYLPVENMLKLMAKGDHRQLVAGGKGFSQDFAATAPLCLVMVIDFERFGNNDDRARLMGSVDAGNVSENINLYCQAAGLATVPRATMDSEGISKLLKLTDKQLPIMNNPVGFPKHADKPVVYFTKEISPESLLRIYQALGVQAGSKVAVKISTGEGGNQHYLRPTLIRQLVEAVDGTIVECCTAYGGTRQDPKKHWETIHQHGFDSIFKCDIMDEKGQFEIPVQDTKHIKSNIVGEHLQNYDCMINLAHFKGHAMGGFGGVLKNASIGVASSQGKSNIHTAGRTSDLRKMWGTIKETPQDEFLESMAAAAQSVHEYMEGRIVYINVMNNMSVDCDCDGNPAKPELMDMGIMASLDPVAVDQACLDKVFNYEGKPGDDNKPLIQRINRQHGTHITEYAEQIGLGSRQYQLVEIK